MTHLIELWEMRGEHQIIYTPACLNCGWVGSDTPRRGDAADEGRFHEEGRRHPWQVAPGEHRTWDGDPMSHRHP